MEATFSQNKHLNFETCAEVLSVYRQQGQKIVLCNGVFDLLHPGHIVHLQAAKAMGDILVISVTASTFVNRGPGRPIFSDELRQNSLAALGCVDYVVITPKVTALEIIEKIRPHIYCKGDEYADPEKDVTGNIKKETDLVEKHGGEVRYTSEITFSSTRLINNHLNVLPDELKQYIKDFSDRHSLEEVIAAVEEMRSLKVLVLGEIIIDEFVHCHVQGLTTKGRVPSTRFLKAEQHLGGVFAVARHLANFAGSVTLASAIGNEKNVQELIEPYENSLDLNLQKIEGYATINKCRYIESKENGEQSQLFAINRIDPAEILVTARQNLRDFLSQNMESYDLVLLVDYGHSWIDPMLREFICQNAPFLALNCQTNSANYGYNLITQYPHADTFCLDERELRLAYSDPSGDCQILLKRLHEHLGGKQGWLTLSASGSWGIQFNNKILDKTPAMTQKIKDTTGAGDAFFALASMSAKLGFPLEFGSFFGNIAAALAANVLGNEKPVAKARLLKYATTLLKF
ncbi:MAG: PfkB family carbohydrate kinase [Cyanobacteria bacterium P01_E01_bin.42]